MIPKQRTIRQITRIARPLLLLSAALLGSLALLYGLWLSPDDYQQGSWVRMMYLHVPAAWLSMGIYVFMGMLSIIYLTGKNPIAFLLAKSAAPIGLCVAIITLLSGMVWGKAIWGAFWVWDARLTSMLLLALLYAGYIMLYLSHEKERIAALFSSIICIAGLINIPIIHFSVEWWNTLHQPASILKFSKSSIDGSMMLPLFLAFFAMLCGALYIGMRRYGKLIAEKQAFRTLQATQH